MQAYIAELEELLMQTRAANNVAATIRVAAELERVRNGGDAEKKTYLPRRHMAMVWTGAGLTYQQ